MKEDTQAVRRDRHLDPPDRRGPLCTLVKRSQASKSSIVSDLLLKHRSIRSRSREAEAKRSKETRKEAEKWTRLKPKQRLRR